MGMHPLPGAVVRASPFSRLPVTLLPREVRKPRERNDGVPFSPDGDRLPACNGARHVRISYAAHRAFARKCTRGHGGEKGAPLMQLVPLTPSFFGVFVVRGRPFLDLASLGKTLPQDTDVRMSTSLTGTLQDQ